MLRTVVSLVAFLGAVLSASTPVEAQAPRVGRDYFEESHDLGFRIKTIKDWGQVPPSPNERNLVALFTPANNSYIELGGGGARLLLGAWLVKIDRRKGDDEDSRSRIKDIETWVKDRLPQGVGWRLEEEVGDLGSKVDAPASVYLYTGNSSVGLAGSEPQPINAYVAVYDLEEDLQVAFVGVGPADKKWRTYEKTYEALAKTFRRVEVVAIERTGSDPRSKKRAKLEAHVASAEGWVLEETPNYFIISSYDDKQFLDELKERLEAMRAIFERDYPIEKARQVKRRSPSPAGARGDDPEGEDPEADDPEADEGEDDGERSISTVDSMALSRTSVVRVCKDQKQYHEYGGPGGTGGYWYSAEEELVIFDDRKNRGRDFTWGVMNHEAFHQYIFYFYGSLAPHSWYNEGTGDFYYGYEYKFKKYKLDAAKNRVSDIQSMIREDQHIPLREFVRWTKNQYYGSNANNLPGYLAYAQGWSLIWFLRTGEDGKAPGWQRSWGKILGKYLDKLAETGDLDEAVDVAFAGVDWDAFEKSWYEYTK